MIIQSIAVIYVCIPVISASFTLICCQHGALHREREKFQRWSVNALSFVMGEHDRLWTDEGDILARTVSKCDIHDYNRVVVSGTP